MTGQSPLLEHIAELLEREHHALVAHDVEALAEIEGARHELLAKLGPAAPEERPAFATLEFLRARNERVANDAIERLGHALGRIGKGRTALAGYRTSVSHDVFSLALDQEV